MAALIPDNQVRFAQLAVKQRYLQPEQVREALAMFRRYQAAGGEVPSVPRILVGKGWLERSKAEALLRHIFTNAPLPQVSGRAVSPGPQAAVAARPPTPGGGTSGLGSLDAELLDESSLDEAAPAANAEGPGANPLVDDREAWIKGMGATVVRKDLVKGYKIVQVRGEGSMGIVYKAHQLSMDRTVALKVLPADKTKDQRFVEEFLAEARNAGRLNHPNLIHVHEVGKSGDVYYYSMEFVEGQRLDEMMDECEGGRLDPKLAVRVFAQICNSLDYGYKAGVLHREIRPNTIMVNTDGQAKLADLGLTKGEQSRFLDGENASYVAPEQISGEKLDTRTDIYSLGCCLFHCLTGEAPFQGGSPMEVLKRRLKVPTPDPQDHNEDLPPSLAKVVMRMMATKAAERFQTPAEVAQALRAVNFTAPSVRKKLGPGRAGLKKPVSGARPGLGVRRPSGSHPGAKPGSARMPAAGDPRKKRFGR
jgi:hypothetical protein